MSAITMDTVRDLIERHSDRISGNTREFYNGAYAEIADELNATLESGTCHMVLREDIRGHAYQDTYECSECGEDVVRETCMGESEPPRFCPNCGRKVVGE